jgi:hypothetical protein
MPVRFTDDDGSEKNATYTAFNGHCIPKLISTEDFFI